MATLPNFLIIGKAKSGTSALYHALRQHPQVFMPDLKEPGFFTYADGKLPYTGLDALDHKRTYTLADYQTLFAPVTTERAIGEASTIYLTPELSERTATHIQQHNPQMRLIAVLRHPVDFIRSLFYFWRMFDNMEPESSLEKALALEDTRAATGVHPGLRYVANARYYAQLKAYYDRFPREQIRVYLYEEWQQTPQEVLRDLFTFIGVDPQAETVAVENRNVTHHTRLRSLRRRIGKPDPVLDIARKFVPKSWRHYWGVRLQRWSRGRPPAVKPKTHRYIIDSVRDDILQTQDLIGKDLSHWLQ